MPKIAYSEKEREQIRENLITVGLELFAKQGIQHTTVEQIYKRVGISRTFFYSFFPAKEDLVVQGFYRQQPKIIELARVCMADPELSWRDGVKRFLYDCFYSKESRFAIMTVEEQQMIYRHLPQDRYRETQERQIRLFMNVLETFGVHADEETAKFVCNLALSMVVVRKAVPAALPFLFAEKADEVFDFQIETLTDYIENLRNQQDTP